MGAFLAMSPTVTVTDGPFNAGSPNYERYQTKTFRFNAGAGTGTVQECGMGTNAGLNYLFSHHLLDTPIVKAANNILDVSYRFTVWPSLIETTAPSVLIDGVNYECKTSFYDLARTALPDQFGKYTVGTDNKVWDGVKAAPTDVTPSGDSAADQSSVSSAFATGSQQMTQSSGLTQGNTTLGIIKTATMQMANWMYIQTEFSALDGGDIGGGIPKDNTKESTLVWTATYGERP
jgi:hypothetical protein